MKTSTVRIIRELLAEENIPKQSVQMAIDICSGQEPPSGKEGLLSIRETCQFLGGLSRCSLYRMARDGDLPCVQVRGRRMFSVDDLRRFVAKHRGGGK